jgi:hypothetical protein
MLPTLKCPQCGNLTSLSSKKTPGRKVRCAACGKDFLIEMADDLLRKPTLMMMGEDEGGGDVGGGGADEEEEEDEEDEDGKKKKKKKKKGFFASLLSGFISYVIGGIILVSLCCCLGVASWFGLLPHTPPFVGEWEGSITKVAKIDLKEIAKGDKDKDTKDKVGKDKDAKGKDGKDKDAKDKDAKDQGDQDDIDIVMVKLVITKTDDKTGAGVYTNEDGKALSFKYKDYDKDAKTVVFELDNKDEKFWKDIKSPAKFTFSVVINDLTLTADGQSMTFAKIVPIKEDKGAPPKKGKKRK